MAKWNNKCLHISSMTAQPWDRAEKIYKLQLFAQNIFQMVRRRNPFVWMAALYDSIGVEETTVQGISRLNFGRRVIFLLISSNHYLLNPYIAISRYNVASFLFSFRIFFFKYLWNFGSYSSTVPTHYWALEYAHKNKSRCNTNKFLKK